MCLCLIVTGAQPGLCFIVVLLIRARSVFEFHGLFSLKRMLFFLLIFPLVISARSILCFKGDSWPYCYSKYR